MEVDGSTPRSSSDDQNTKDKKLKVKYFLFLKNVKVFFCRNCSYHRGKLVIDFGNNLNTFKDFVKDYRKRISRTNTFVLVTRIVIGVKLTTAEMGS